MKKYFTLILFSLLFFSSEIYSQWYVQYQSSGVIYDVRFIDRTTGWACGGGMILKTTNGGENWNLRSVEGSINQIHPVNDSVVYACGDFVIYKTTDGGNNWTAVRIGTNQVPRLYGLWFIDENTGWFCGDRAVMRTTNGGQSFIDSMFIDSELNDVHFKNYSTGNIAAWGRTYRTTNSGTNWYPVELPAETEVPFVEKVTFVGDTGWTFSNAGRVYRTTNYGISWDSISLILLSGRSIEFANSRIGYAGGINGKIYKSTNGGFNWFLSLNIGIGSFVSIYSFSDSIVWAAGGSGKIVHTSTGGITYISNSNIKFNESYKLYQNYPNPFNPGTNLKFELRKKLNLKLKVYNSSGQLINELLNKNLIPGIYNIYFDAKDLSSGIYFYQLETEDFKETKRMILIK